MLEDPKNNFAAQNVLPLINKAKATDNGQADAERVSAKLTTEDLTKLNAEADGRREAEPGDRGEELAVAERPGLIAAVVGGQCRARRKRDARPCAAGARMVVIVR